MLKTGLIFDVLELENPFPVENKCLQRSRNVNRDITSSSLQVRTSDSRSPQRKQRAAPALEIRFRLI